MRLAAIWRYTTQRPEHPSCKQPQEIGHAYEAARKESMNSSHLISLGILGGGSSGFRCPKGTVIYSYASTEWQLTNAASLLLQAMAEDARRAAHAVTQLERELAVCQGHMAAQAQEMAGLQEAQRSAQVQINQYVVDLQVTVSLPYSWGIRTSTHTPMRAHTHTCAAHAA